MGKSKFYHILKRYMKGLLSDEEKARFDAWLDSLNKDDEEKVRWSEAHQNKLFDKISQGIKSPPRINAKPEARTHTLSINGWLKIAAAVLLLVSVSYYIWKIENPTMLVVSTNGAVQKVMLEDGTIVWLRGYSSLTYPKRFGDEERNVQLHGEGLFEVAKNPLHPFIIQCGALKATVLGTSFNIKSARDNIEVMVLTGKVNLSSSTDKQGILVLPNEKVVYNGQKQVAKSITDENEISLVTARTEYSMKFKDTRMDEIIRRIEGKFNVKVSTDNLINNCMITADFTDQSIDNTLRKISEVLEFEYKIKDGAVTIRGGGCQ